MRKLDLNSQSDIQSFMNYVRGYYISMAQRISSTTYDRDLELLAPQCIGNLIRRYSIGEADILVFGDSESYIYILYSDRIKEKTFPYIDVDLNLPVVFISTYDENFKEWDELHDYLRNSGYTEYYIFSDSDFQPPIEYATIYESGYFKLMRCRL